MTGNIDIFDFQSFWVNQSPPYLKPGGEDEQGAEDEDKLGWQWQEAFLLLPLYQNAAVGDREEAQEDRKYKERERYFQIHRDCGLRF